MAVICISNVSPETRSTDEPALAGSGVENRPRGSHREQATFLKFN